MSSRASASGSVAAPRPSVCVTVRFFALSMCFHRTFPYCHGRLQAPIYQLVITRRKWVQPGVWLIQIARGDAGRRRTPPDRVIFRCWQVPLPRLSAQDRQQ
jgi:hypothetical protein